MNLATMVTNVQNIIDCVGSKNVQSSHQEALLYLFQDNEAGKESHNETCFQDPQSSA